ncbi:FAD-dependent oxidoreductase [Rudanella paleaurantiibacter]|uniref:FAD-dependent oxidoreductase n=1 Tax=Rudanella paleaurantiibacter TaxID=2614655 RepID=A0A7J5U5M2_9BACT|nr:FAD-dependent oxidoreductase [Rudanella paleaurantiibacter]KAB7732941.1 FAD-dependent oxidoreductase [Rudanella paleaurantiibacter]
MKRILPVLLFVLFSIPGLAQTYDICVYGGNSAGVMAAVAAKRAGKSVILIEPGKHLGGLTAGGLGATDIGNKFAITGLSRDFYRRIGQHYGKFEQWTFEPHVAENLFKQYLREARIEPLMAYRIINAQKQGNRLVSITVEPASGAKGQNRTIAARQFLDCTYEGDLMAQAGVSFTVGREPNRQYGETWNGVQYLDKHQFPDGVDPYVIPGKPESGLIYGVSATKLAPDGTGDAAVQAYNYRMCLTDDPANRVPITRPEGYDSTRYELLLRQIKASPKVPDVLTWNLMHFVPMPNRKTDINNCGGMSTDMIGANFEYPTASYARREAIIREHEQYTKGFFYFIGHDPRMPKHLRDEMLQWGYPKDEYTDNGHFSHQLYVREARRMVGEYVMTQANCEGKTAVTDGVGMAAYTMDSHNCQRVVVEKDGRMMVKNEGDVQVGGFPPYPVSYRSLVPKRAEVQNLLVPVCLSASHIAYGSIRMEPVFMVLAQSAAVAACQAIDEQRPVQDIDIKKLQARLATDPLLSGQAAEVLIDNDDANRVTRSGAWERTTKGGKYGTSMLVSQSDASARVTFQAANARPGRYKVYLYNPLLQGGGGNPDQVGRQSDKANRVTVLLSDGKTEKKLTVDQQVQNNDWISLGEHALSGPPALTITTAGNTAPVVADAVLFVPIN